MGKIKLGDQVMLKAGRKKISSARGKVIGTFHLVHKDVKGNVIDEEIISNLITTEGLNYLLDSALNAAGAWVTPYFAIFTSGSPAAGDTYAVPASTEATNYDEATRQEWANGASAAGVMTNASAATITASSSLAVTNIGVVGVTGTQGNIAVKDDQATSSAVLLCKVASVKTLSTAETLDITYTITITDT